MVIYTCLCEFVYSLDEDNKQLVAKPGLVLELPQPVPILEFAVLVGWAKKQEKTDTKKEEKTDTKKEEKTDTKKEEKTDT